MDRLLVREGTKRMVTKLTDMANLAWTEMYIKVNTKEEHRAVEALLREHFDVDMIYPDEELEDDDYPYTLEVSMSTKGSFPYHFFNETFITTFPYVKWNATSSEPGNNHRCLASYRPDRDDFIEPVEIEEYYSEL